MNAHGAKEPVRGRPCVHVSLIEVLLRIERGGCRSESGGEKEVESSPGRIDQHALAQFDLARA